MTLSGFWETGLIGSPDNMNRCLLQFDTDANIQAIGTFKENTIWFATDTRKLYQDTGAAIQFLGWVINDNAQPTRLQISGADGRLINLQASSSSPFEHIGTTSNHNFHLIRNGAIIAVLLADRFRVEIGRIDILDAAADPTVNGEFTLNGSDVKVFSGGKARNLSTEIVKAFGTVASDGTLQANSFNISGVVRDATGNYTVSFDTDFANTNYTVVATPEDPDSNAQISVSTPALGSIKVHTSTSGGNNDKAFHLMAFGDQ